MSANGLIAQMTIGERVKRIRNRQELEQQEVARRAGMPPQTISDLERGKIDNPTLETLRRVAEALDIGVDELVGPGVSVDRASLPSGLKSLVEDPEWSEELTDEWLYVLLHIQYGGRSLETKREFLEAYLALNRILGE